MHCINNESLILFKEFHVKNLLLRITCMTDLFNYDHLISSNAFFLEDVLNGSFLILLGHDTVHFTMLSHDCCCNEMKSNSF